MAALEVLPGPDGIEKGLAEIERRMREETDLDRARRAPTTPAEMMAAEVEHIRACRRRADLCTAEDIITAHMDPQFRGEACHEAREQMKARNSGHGIEDGGWQPVCIRLSGGLELRMHTRYLWPSRKGAPGRRRGNGKRGPAGVGCYPILERLGIREGVTPATRSEIGRQVVLCSSIEEAGEQLARGGLELHPSTITRIACSTGDEAVRLRDEALDQARTSPLPVTSSLSGKRVRISVDGGRARTRRTQRGRGVRPGKNGRRPFTLEWKEPRVITVDMLDDKGDMDRSWHPIYEVTMGDADETFALLSGLLRRVGVHLAAVVLFVSDGAEWIWRRIAAALAEAGVSEERIRLVLDCYHASEYIAAALDLCKDMSAEKCEALRKELCKLLLAPGGPSQVIARLRQLGKGRRARKIHKKVDYLEKHLQHMPYAELKAEKLPIGSGIVESAVRRIINLRFKSASMCWRPDHLRPLLYLRAILKSGRWDTFMTAWLAGKHWLEPGIGASQRVPSPMAMAA